MSYRSVGRQVPGSLLRGTEGLGTGAHLLGWEKGLACLVGLGLWSGFLTQVGKASSFPRLSSNTCSPLLCFGP